MHNKKAKRPDYDENFFYDKTMLMKRQLSRHSNRSYGREKVCNLKKSSHC